MKISHENLPSNKRFGFFFVFVFFITAIFFLLNEAYILTSFFSTLGLVFLCITIVKDSLLLPLNKLWMSLGFFLGRFVTPIILALIFFIIFTPIAIFMKIIQRDELRLRPSNKKTFWINRSDQSFDEESFFRQF